MPLSETQNIASAQNAGVKPAEPSLVGQLRAKQLSEAIYKKFGDGDIEGIDALVAADCAFKWAGPDGTVESKGWRGPGSQVENVISMVPESWPGFKLTPLEYIYEGNKCFIQLRATTDAGMDTTFGHYVEFNDEGKMSRWVGFDDSAAAARYRQNTPTPPSSTARLTTHAPESNDDSHDVWDYARSKQAKQLSEAIYKKFGDGDIEGIDALVAADCAFKWNGPDGTVESKGWLGPGSQVENVISMVPESWPGFKLTPLEYISKGNKCFIQLRATTDAGMDTTFGHYVEFNSEGKMSRWVGFDDSAAAARYKQEEATAEAVVAGSVETMAASAEAVVEPVEAVVAGSVEAMAASAEAVVEPAEPVEPVEAVVAGSVEAMAASAEAAVQPVEGVVEAAAEPAVGTAAPMPMGEKRAGLAPDAAADAVAEAAEAEAPQEEKESRDLARQCYLRGGSA